MKFAGVDYGSKLAGTTVIAYLKDNTVHFLQSAKKQDADAFLLQKIQSLGITHLFLDAPLSLPGVYRDLNGFEDYFYRIADRDLKGMSPMFLGGLTARAIRLSKQFEKLSIKVTETYPGHLARILQLSDFQYKKQKEHLPKCSARLMELMNLPFEVEMIQNWHQMDALLAFYSAWRFQQGKHQIFGDEVEGMIFV